VSNQSGGGLENLLFASLIGPTYPAVNFGAIEHIIPPDMSRRGYTLADTHKHSHYPSRSCINTAQWLISQYILPGWQEITSLSSLAQGYTTNEIKRGEDRSVLPIKESTQTMDFALEGRKSISSTPYPVRDLTVVRYQPRNKYILHFRHAIFVQNFRNRTQDTCGNVGSRNQRFYYAQASIHLPNDPY